MAGQLLGIKTALNEFVAYLYLSDAEAYPLEKEWLIMLYALCGFANFSSVGILLSGLVPWFLKNGPDFYFWEGLMGCFTGFLLNWIYGWYTLGSTYVFFLKMFSTYRNIFSSPPISI